MTQARLYLVAAIAATFAACDAENVEVQPAAGRVGASIAVVSGGERVVVVNPDQGSVSLLDAKTLEQVGTVDVGGEPHSLLALANDDVLVATYRSGEVVRLHLPDLAITQRFAACAGAFGLATMNDEKSVVVSCEWEGAALQLSASTLTLEKRHEGFFRPRAVATLGDRLVVAEYVGGRVHSIASDGSRSTQSLVPESAPYRPALSAMSANLATAIVPSGGRLHIAHVLENHTGDQAHERVADDYGSVVDTNPKINPALTPLGATGAPVTYAKPDGGTRVFSGPSAITAFGNRLLVVHVSTKNVAVIDRDAATPEARVIGSFTVGAGPHGIAVDDAHRVAFVDNTFDRSVSRLELDQPFDAAAAPKFAASLTRVRSLPEPYSAAALAGRKLFYDATNAHVTPSAVVVCASCHPGGGDDGLVWFMHTNKIALKRRRTPHLASSLSSTAPFHWDGQFKGMGELVKATMTDLMAGDGLLVDVDTVQKYIDEMVKPPVPPAAKDPAAVARGKAIFQGKAECSSCHSGDTFSDGAMHAVLTPMSLSSDDGIAETNTPDLRGLFLRAPYFHDGRSPDLRDAVTRTDASNHGNIRALAPIDIDDLIAYLKSL